MGTVSHETRPEHQNPNTAKDNNSQQNHLMESMSTQNGRNRLDEARGQIWDMSNMKT